MADIEGRVTALERDVSALKARVAIHDDEMQNIPNVIKMEARFTNAQIARLSSDIADLQSKFAQMDSKLGGLPEKVDALPRVIAELVTEMIDERDRRR
jgi:outer membrane murein-binding lipoprotein Lpp